MKKTERVNLIMRYINNRAKFTISEIQNEFAISRATAIRDIQEIEAMGLPLVTERGRAGGYFVLQNEYLPAVHFTPDELRAIFISFMASKNSQLPFLKNRKNIAEKLIGIAPQTQQDALVEMEKLIFFDNTNPYNPSILELSDAAPAILNTIISQVLEQRHLEISYLKPRSEEAENREIFVEHIYNTNGIWYLDCYDVGKSAKRNFRVDRIQASKLSEKNIKKFVKSEEKEIPNLIVRLGNSAIQRFKRQHPFGATLQYLDLYQQTAKIEFYIEEKNQRELDYVMDWLLFLGDDLVYEEIPQILLENIKQRLKDRLKVFEKIEKVDFQRKST
ncbi:MAG: WYL domain-containing protein [Streptococcaceae bacterium]|jgi:predicted DNA-binding transcriptional regulator YafY|nr:WYL domain-containing protein [Streptococcaceae bacterium]